MNTYLTEAIILLAVLLALFLLWLFAKRINPEHFDHRSADPSISFAPGSPICHPLGRAFLSPGLLILLPGKVEPHGQSP